MQGYDYRKTFSTALKQSAPIMFAYIVVGFTFGAMMSEAGYTWIHTVIASFFTYSGSMQIAMVPMMVYHTSLPAMAVATLLINSRYMFYGIGFAERFKRQGILYPYMIIAFPDEVYGIFCSNKHPSDVDPDKCDLWSALLCHFAWTFGGLLGVLIGDNLPISLEGIDFAATAMFVCITVNQWTEYKNHIPMYIGVVSGIVCLLVLGPDNFILPSLIVSLIVLLIMKSRMTAIEEKEAHHE
ncbi:MAG: AzlC family ABC transporter permease [Lachnospiraceae bacterium]|nr:AzlC family ABC transporter permease [Lachnospiraceae bacterium]